MKSYRVIVSAFILALAVTLPVLLVGCSQMPRAASTDSDSAPQEMEPGDRADGKSSESGDMEIIVLPSSQFIGSPVTYSPRATPRMSIGRFSSGAEGARGRLARKGNVSTL